MLMLANKVSGGINLYCLPSSQISWLKKFITIHRWNLLFPDDYRWPLFEVLGMFFKVWSVVWSKACYLKYEAFICGIQNEVLFDYRIISMEFNSCERASYIAKYSLIDCQEVVLLVVKVVDSSPESVDDGLKPSTPLSTPPTRGVCRTGVSNVTGVASKQQS